MSDPSLRDRWHAAYAEIIAFCAEGAIDTPERIAEQKRLLGVLLAIFFEVVSATPEDRLLRALERAEERRRERVRPGEAGVGSHRKGRNRES